MKSAILVVVACGVLSARPAVAQARLSPVDAVRVLQGTPTAQNWTGRAVYVPDRPTADVVSTRADVTAGPFGPFSAPVPLRRLDGSSYLEPQWELRAYDWSTPIVVVDRGRTRSRSSSHPRREK